MGLPQPVEDQHMPEEKIQESSVAPVAKIAVAAAALGYFVDVFDMWLFANFRVPSLEAIGLSGVALTDTGAFLQNCQQAGFLLGGFAWGMLGDKRGRVSVMFGSILLYSLATFLNGFVTSVEQYAILRFVTGFGLAGEIGAGITLVSELLSKHNRGYGTTIVATLGVAGAIGAAVVGKLMHWQDAYILGGVLGFLLLLLRFAVYESGMYDSMAKADGIKKGSLRLLFGSRDRFLRYLCCVLAGVPIYVVFGLIVFFAPEIGASLGILEKISVPDVMLFASIGITLGDLLSGVLSQKMKSRKKPMYLFQSVGFLTAIALFTVPPSTSHGYAIYCGILGLMIGYWACLLTTTAEQFGTNIRATVTTTVPNLIRATAIPLAMMFVYLKSITTVATAALTLTVLYFGLGLIGLLGLKETYGKDLNHFEE